MQLVFVSVLKLNFSDGGPLYVGRAEHEGGLFPGKVKSVLFYLLGAKSGTCQSLFLCLLSSAPKSHVLSHILHTR